jgi:hypothetical protein
MENITGIERRHAAVIKPLRWLSGLLFISALASIAVLLLSDMARRYAFNTAHQHTGAFPLIFIGLSYICLQFSAARPLGEVTRGFLLGLAFVMWGTEQLLPASALVTVMDGAVITIFVIDLGLMIFEKLREKQS